MNSKHTFEEMKETLYSAVIADILDEMGYRNQAMANDILPLKVDDVVCGTAFTVLATDVYEIPAEPYKFEFEAVDHLQPGDVMVATTNGSTCSGFWGELLTNGCLKRGAVGCVLDGYSRDTKEIRKLPFSLFLKGTNPLDSKGRTDVIAYQCTVVCGGVEVHPGDVIFGDCDGIVVVPKDIAEECIDRAFEKVKAEDVVRDELRSGVSTTEVYAKYGIL